MFQHIKLNSLDDYFLNLSQRKGNNVFFYRINSYSDSIREFLCRYYEEARKNGVIIDGRIPNADQNNLSYYYETMGDSFSMNKQFFMLSLKKWLPRMNDTQRIAVAGSVYDTLSHLASQGKNENILKNAYIKFMCWLYYRFGSITNRLGGNNIPKILYNGTINIYELMLISILSKAGCDVVLLQTAGDSGYIKVDPTSELSRAYTGAGQAFPADFSIKQIQQEIADKMHAERVFGQKPSYIIVTNSWARGDGLEDALTPVDKRGNQSGSIYNIFYRINGVYNRADYVNELISFKSEINSQKRNIVIADGEISAPSYDELSTVKRGNYSSPQTAVAELSKNIEFAGDEGLQQIMRYEFAKLMLEKSKESGMTINKLVNMCVY
ncbi:MAG: YceG family protein, partial [Ruminococcus sp.]|nr:YceG family protein [Ruminococcus sp.]